MYGLPEIALIDMGDFVGGMLKYLRSHPVPRVTIAGGVGKMTKLAQGLLDLHSKRGSVDLVALAKLAERAGGSRDLAAYILTANTRPKPSLMRGRRRCARRRSGECRRETATAVVAGKDIDIEVVLFDREAGSGRAPFAASHARAPAEAAAIIGVVKRAVAESLPPPRRGPPGSAPCARSAPRRALPAISPSVPRTIFSSGQLAWPPRRPGSPRRRTGSARHDSVEALDRQDELQAWHRSRRKRRGFRLPACARRGLGCG
jgi:hypothetical protein